MKIEQAKKDFIEIIRSGETDQNTIGAEFEHFIVNRNTLQTYHYYEKNGIRDILLKLTDLGWETSDSYDKIMVLKKSNGVISLEPGAQIEFSTVPCKTIYEMDESYCSFIADLKSVLLKEQAIVSLGYHPRSLVADIPFIPKARYKAMSEYFNNTGIYAHNMMKGTASTQVAIDFSSERDMANKFSMFNALSPFISAYFDTTPIFEGEKVKGHAMRMQIWQQTDKVRSGVCACAFDTEFGYDRYTDVLLNLPPILVIDGADVKVTGEKPVRALIDKIDYSKEQLEHIMTMIFTDVRIKHFLEVRMADAMPYPLNIGYVALIKTLAYNKTLLKKYSDWAKTISYTEIEQLKSEVALKGREAVFRDQTVDAFMQSLLNEACAFDSTSKFLKHLVSYYEKANIFAGGDADLSEVVLLKLVEVTIDE